MKKVSQILLAGAGAMALSACGSADDASADAEADTVEMPAENALEGVSEEPVEDADASSEDTEAGPGDIDASDAADAAEDVAAAAEAAEDMPE